MKIRSLIGLSTAAFLMTGCSDKLDFNSTVTKGVLEATVETNRPDTRVGFDQSAKFYWSKGDKLGVTTTQSTEAFTALDIKSGVGEGSGSFEGTVIGEIGQYAVYPYNSSHKISNSTLTYNFPASYTYTKVDQDFFTTNKGEGNSFNPPMWGKIENGNVNLKHLGGVFCIKIEKMPVASGTLALSTDKAINGDFTASLTDNDPKLTAAEDAATTANTDATNTDGTKKVTIEFSGATQDQPGVFYVPVPTGSYGNIRITLTSGDDTKIDVPAGNYVVERKDLRKLVLSNASINAGEAGEAASASDVQNAFGSNDAVTVTGQISDANTVTIPAASTDATAKTLFLTDVNSGAKLTVEDGAGNSTSVKDFTLSIPNNNAGTDPLKVTINMPETTVTLAGNAGTAVYGEVTATTADNTLVVSGGVTVNKIIVKKGNIRVEKGAEVKAIVKDKSNSGSVIVYKEEGAIIPDNLAEGITVIDAAAEENMQKVLAEGGTYALTQNMVGDYVVSATSPVTINLNGHNITNKSGDTFTVNFGSTLTIEGSGTVDNVTHKKACIYNNGTVTLKGGTYTRSKENGKDSENSGGNSYYNILNHGTMTINSGVAVSQDGYFSSMIANGYYKYSNNSDPRIGYVDGTNAATPKLTIEGGTFSGGLNTVKNDDGAELTINDGDFSNVSQAVVQNHHITIINGGTFNATDAKYVVDNAGDKSAYDNGKMTITGGIFKGIIHDRNTGNALTITGGSFTDSNAKNYAYGTDKEKVTIITGDTSN